MLARRDTDENNANFTLFLRLKKMHDSTRIETSWSILLLGVFVGFSLFAVKALSPLPPGPSMEGFVCPGKEGVGNQIPAAKIACTGNSVEPQKASAQTEDKSTYSMRP
jgi:hypothetical protein